MIVQGGFLRENRGFFSNNGPPLTGEWLIREDFMKIYENFEVLSVHPEKGKTEIAQNNAYTARSKPQYSKQQTPIQ